MLTKPTASITFICQVLWLASLSFLPKDALAACDFFDDFRDNKNGTVTDPRNGLIWKRCAEGFTWKDGKCTGSVKKGTWFDAMDAAKRSQFLGKNDWRLPTKSEFVNVMGTADACNDNDQKIGQYAVSKMIAHPIEGPYVGEFWSSSSGDDDSQAWNARFGSGALYSSIRSLIAFKYRFVRDGKASDANAPSEFEREAKNAEKYKTKTDSEFKRLAQDSIDHEKKQGIYSPENQAQRKRDAEQARQAGQLCEAQKQTCLASCGEISYWNGKTRVENQSWSGCKSKCESISCR